MNILYVYADRKLEWNCAEWRCVYPMLAINQTGEHQAHLLAIEDFAAFRPAAQVECAWADVIVLQRNAFNNVLVGMEYWKARDKTILLDLDDDYFSMPATCNAYAFWYNGTYHSNGKTQTMAYAPIEQIVWAAKLAHAVTTPSRLIMDDWNQRGARACWVPNYVDVKHYRGEYAAHADDMLILGWGGSLSHLESFRQSGVVTAINRLMRTYRNIHLSIAGGDSAIFRLFDCPPDRKSLHPWVLPAEWPVLLSTFDVGIAPLHGAYDARRSWIKGMEYTLMGIPWVGTDAIPFQDVPTGLRVPNQAKAWEVALEEQFVNLKSKREKAQLAATELAPLFDIHTHVGEIIDTYTTIRSSHL